MTTLPITSVADAILVIKIYQKRWLIEEFFKLIKTDGYNIENTELTTGTSIRKLVLYVMKTSIKVQQLKAVRNGKIEASIDTMFTKFEIKALNKIGPTVEGNTVRQKNPHSPDTLAYVAWIIARLGGWKEFYNPNRPPGNKTFVWGLEKFEIMCLGISIQDVS